MRSRLIRRTRFFLRNKRGAISVITALSLTVLIAFTAGAVDFGNVFLHARQLQGMADLAAMAAANDLTHAQAAATATAQANNWDAPITTGVTTGIYQPVASIAVDKRFTPDNTTAKNAAQVTLKSSAPLYFASLILGRSSLSLTRTATAARAELASFSIGSRLLSLQGGIANSVLSALLGSSVNLSVMDYNALASAQVDLFQYSNAMKSRLNLQAASFNQTLSTKMTTADALGGIADVLNSNGHASAAHAMQTIADAAGNQKIEIGNLMDLGPYGDQDYLNPNGGSGVTVSALDLATAALGLAQGGHQVQFNLATGVPGLTKVTATLAIGQRPANSPWIAVTDKDDVIVRTAQARLYIDAQVAPAGSALSSVASIDVPIFVELASAQAKLSSMECGLTPADNSVTLSVAPSIGQAAIASIDLSSFDDFETDETLGYAPLIKTALIQVTGFADAKLGGLSWQQVSFNGTDIAAGTVKTVKTNDRMQSLFTSLLGTLDLKVKLLGLGLGLGTGPVTSAVANSLSGVAAPLDGVVNSLTGLLGLGLGEADVRVNGVRCNAVALVR
ncbi:MAG TPA: pilus assembly protein TadG-related protein [Rhizomicrobium sp.]|nr:pilus assembly protein TadG-related protein [Rhizomicrobium sp.]